MLDSLWKPYILTHFLSTDVTGKKFIMASVTVNLWNIIILINVKASVMCELKKILEYVNIKLFKDIRWLEKSIFLWLGQS